MATEIEICNAALIKLGQALIMSLDDDIASARACKQRFTPVFEAVLRSYPWPFAVKRASLARLQERPAFGATYYYQLPGDYVRTVEIDVDQRDYKIEGRRIATDADQVQLRYLSNNISMGELDPMVTELVALSLAADICITLTESQELANSLASQARMQASLARQTYSAENNPICPEEGLWLTSRWW